jgi:SAM-dependent methyltransferase
MRERSGFARFLLRLARPLWRIRRVALLSELVFWDRWLAKRLDDPALAELLREDRPVPSGLVRLVEQAPPGKVRILEVGAGPIGAVGDRHPTREVEVVPTDILADEYNKVLRRRGLRPKNPTRRADMERLVEQFGAETFDVVVAANCIDHTGDAPRALEEMVGVLRPGGTVVMDHFEDEGAHQDYAGLHQWNLSAAEGRLVLWNEARRYDAAAALGASCEVRVTVADGNVHAEIRKLRAAR